MRVKRLIAILACALGLAVTATPEVSGAPDPCVNYSGITHCLPGLVCGQYTNASGEKVCGCHAPR
jgi:hypothetical protein